MSKKTAPKTRDEMEDLVREICELEIRADEIKVRMDEEVLRVRTRHQDDLTSLKGEIDEKLKLAEDWALANQNEFASRKSIVMIHGTVLYRTGTPKLKTLRGVTWAKVLERLRAAFPEYVRTEPEIAKDSIIADRDRLGPETLNRMGVEITQDETFAVEPHREEVAS